MTHIVPLGPSVSSVWKHPHTLLCCVHLSVIHRSRWKGFPSVNPSMPKINPINRGRHRGGTTFLSMIIIIWVCLMHCIIYLVIITLWHRGVARYSGPSDCIEAFNGSFWVQCQGLWICQGIHALPTPMFWHTQYWLSLFSWNLALGLSRERPTQTCSSYYEVFLSLSRGMQ